MKDTFAENDPLSIIVNILEKANYDKLASEVLDVFALMSNSIEQFNLISKLYLDIRDIEKTEKYALKVLSMTTSVEESYNARANLAKMYNNINKPEKSLANSNINKLVDPENVDTQLEMVFSYYLLNKKSEAEIILRKLKGIEGELSEHHRNIVDFNLGTYDMEKGLLIKGLAGFLINIKKLELWFSSRTLDFKYWNGGLYPGQTLVMFLEGGGIGDEFITVRWYDNLKNLGFNPIYYSQRPEIAEIFNRCGYKTITSDAEIPEGSLWTFAMECPLWLEVKPEEVLREKYLWPSDEARHRWAYIGQCSKIKIGVRWSGNKKNERDLHRAISLSSIMTMLHSIFDNSNLEVEYYSLQIGDGSEELVNYPELIDLSSQIKSFDDTFAILEGLDFVISSCTSVLHASAIMGTRTLGLIPISAYFTWLSPILPGRASRSSIFYGDNLELYRQVTPNSWDEPLNEIKEVLEAEYVRQ